MGTASQDEVLDTIDYAPSSISFHIVTKGSLRVLDGQDRLARYAPAAPATRRLPYRFFKRLFDIVFSVCVIAILLVPSLILCVAIVLESPGAPIYVQRRVRSFTGEKGVETFFMFKFRSMYRDADARLEGLRERNEATAPLFKIRDDPRVTKIGKFIRCHSIDELPQFINCFLGQLSVVGPRPPLPDEVLQYDAFAMRRLAVKQGITGYWQVRGRGDMTFEDMVEHDLEYIQERSMGIDFGVICKTIHLVVTGEGAC